MQFDDLLNKLAKPAQRALQNENINTMEELLRYTEKEVLELHGIGKNAMNIIRQTLLENGLSFSNNGEDN